MSSKPKPGKHLIITYGKDGLLETVSVSTPLEIVYEAMFNQAEQSFSAGPSEIANGIQVIIFGSFWLEARTNNVTQEFLWRFLGQNPVRELVWRHLKKSSTFEKLDFVGGLCSAEEANELRLLASRVRKAFELRNRLAHFKAEEELVADAPDNVEQILRQAMTLPETDLEAILKDPTIIHEHASTFRAAALWLESVRSSKRAA